MTEHEKWIDLALAISQEQRGLTNPNPWVGCVIVGNEDRVYSGTTQPPGGKHAEIVALEKAGSKAKDSVMYVTLEPCSHYGRTPPCTKEIIKAGVKEIFISILDPDPKVSGKGIKELESAGIKCHLGIASKKVAEELLPYLKHRVLRKPFVILKLAATTDGYIAAGDYSSKWITGDEARYDTHKLRSESDAILVGANTIRLDDPELNVRLATGKDPLRIVLGQAANDRKAQPILQWEKSVEELLSYLGENSILQLLIEGGSKVAGLFHKKQLVDKYVIYLSPSFLGDNTGISMMTGSNIKNISDIWRGKFHNIQKIGDDLRIDIVPKSFDTMIDDLIQYSDKAILEKKKS